MNRASSMIAMAGQRAEPNKYLSFASCAMDPRNHGDSRFARGFSRLCDEPTHLRVAGCAKASVEDGGAGITGAIAQLLLDTDELVILGEPVRTGEAAGLD